MTKMTKDEIKALIDRSLFADLGYLDGDGKPSVRRVYCTWHRGIGRHLISTNTSSSHVRDIMKNGGACLYFADSASFEGVCLSGTARVRADREVKRLLWHPQDVRYYPEGVDDPDYCVIEFTADGGRYYRADGKGDLTGDEIAAYDAGAVYEDGFAKTRPKN